IFLPGTNRAADGFVRASYYIEAIPQTDTTRGAVSRVYSVLRNRSVPYGLMTQGFQFLSTIIQRRVPDQKHMNDYYEHTHSPNAVCIDFKNLDFSPSTGKVKKLSLDKQQVYAGETSDKFVVTKPFVFQGI